MSLTVRFSTGVAVRYNDAYYLAYKDGFWEMYSDSAHSHWIASILASSGAIVESAHPCSVENAVQVSSELQALRIVEAMFEEGRHANGCGPLVASIKKHLEYFNRQTWRWRKK